MFEDTGYPYQWMRNPLQAPRYWLPYWCYTHVRQIRAVLEATGFREGNHGGWNWIKDTGTLHVYGRAEYRPQGNKPYKLQNFEPREVEVWKWTMCGDLLYRFLERMHRYPLDDIPRILAMDTYDGACLLLERQDLGRMPPGAVELMHMAIQDVGIPYLTLRLEHGI